MSARACVRARVRVSVRKYALKVRYLGAFGWVRFGNRTAVLLYRFSFAVTPRFVILNIVGPLQG